MGLANVETGVVDEPVGKMIEKLSLIIVSLRNVRPDLFDPRGQITQETIRPGITSSEDEVGKGIRALEEHVRQEP